MAPSSKAYDILVFGATGFTGQLVARYLSTQPGFNFAVVGRSRDKLERRMKEVDVEPAAYFVADASDEGELRKIVKQGKVVISLVGPYIKHGLPLVKVCAEEGVHYADLTGEPAFIYKSSSRYSRSALDSKAIIVHSSGFDSIPSDLCTFLAVQKLKSLGEGVQAGDVLSSFKAKGGMSGGTLASIMEMLEMSKEERALTSKPYCLSPVESSHNPLPIVLTSQTFNSRRTSWLSFWLMSAINSKIVRRSWGILESADPSSRVLSYGPNFKYDEGMVARSPFKALLTSISLFVGFAALYFLPPVKWLVKRYGPQSGDGPTKEQQEKGWFEVATVAKSDKFREDGKEVRVVMKGKGDPGYSATAIMISSVALSLLHDHSRLPTLAQHGGHLTPATALGEVLVERLEKTGRFSFEVEVGRGKEGRGRKEL